MKTIDLFCGAGGLTEGFKQVGGECLYANDAMPEAIETFRNNHPEVEADCSNIESVSPAEVRKKLALSVGELDALVGGPPCQGFSINSSGRFLDDPRNKLFRHYERFLAEFLPKTFVFENVPGLLSLADGRVFKEIVEIFQGLGYFVTAKILFAAHYGVPQERWRLILLGSQLGHISHPEPTHFAIGRSNFRGGGDLIYRLNEQHRMQLLPAVNVREAIADLPRINMGEGGEICYYDKPAESPFARAVRSTDLCTFNHYARVLPEIHLLRMAHVRPGGSWRDIPFDLLPKGMQRAKRSDHTKRYGRLDFEKLPGTVLTKCDPHWGSVVLPDQDRVLTVREVARFQSFPDKYRFFGPRAAQYKQVGNAVPVFMAKAIARSVKDHLSKHGLWQRAA